MTGLLCDFQGGLALKFSGGGGSPGVLVLPIPPSRSVHDIAISSLMTSSTKAFFFSSDCKLNRFFFFTAS